MERAQADAEGAGTAGRADGADGAEGLEGCDGAEGWLPLRPMITKELGGTVSFSAEVCAPRRISGEVCCRVVVVRSGPLRVVERVIVLRPQGAIAEGATVTVELPRIPVPRWPGEVRVTLSALGRYTARV